MVISFNPGNGVVYLAVIFTRDLKAEYAGGPSARYFYVIQILCSSLSRPLIRLAIVRLSLPMTRVIPFVSVVFDLKGDFMHTRVLSSPSFFPVVSSRKYLYVK